ncbi:hypothetical protein PPIS_a1875 [Pseudoalteromonas piscicida]|uniref:Uncharacterized protein n=1 Tax=Pseudoalteromonas piscicida TaxID=43662 RepID=A0ABN5CIE1_PSEO7|nr:hypothetical protein PPIS_a1875 [Pseudoalteromonas piscicida]
MEIIKAKIQAKVKNIKKITWFLVNLFIFCSLSLNINELGEYAF